eukprot:TRINITY_DN5814_c0_g1_i1.p1 TRINITY_DN5814_c0_g1~~TRINITY_DN5814_c0_g1_i1.p1  ORF type:complete len:639 (+),score=101.42 TRINITY_DN5814_c0_g1_i1:1184-3100(+)
MATADVLPLPQAELAPQTPPTQEAEHPSSHTAVIEGDPPPPPESGAAEGEPAPPTETGPPPSAFPETAAEVDALRVVLQGLPRVAKCAALSYEEYEKYVSRGESVIITDPAVIGQLFGLPFPNWREAEAKLPAGCVVGPTGETLQLSMSQLLQLPETEWQGQRARDVPLSGMVAKTQPVEPRGEMNDYRWLRCSSPHNLLSYIDEAPHHMQAYYSVPKRNPEGELLPSYAIGVHLEPAMHASLNSNLGDGNGEGDLTILLIDLGHTVSGVQHSEDSTAPLSALEKLRDKLLEDGQPDIYNPPDSAHLFSFKHVNPAALIQACIDVDIRVWATDSLPGETIMLHHKHAHVFYLGNLFDPTRSLRPALRLSFNYCDHVTSRVYPLYHAFMKTKCKDTMLDMAGLMQSVVDDRDKMSVIPAVVRPTLFQLCFLLFRRTLRDLKLLSQWGLDHLLNKSVKGPGVLCEHCLTELWNIRLSAKFDGKRQSAWYCIDCCFQRLEAILAQQEEEPNPAPAKFDRLPVDLRQSVRVCYSFSPDKLTNGLKRLDFGLCRNPAVARYFQRAPKCSAGSDMCSNCANPSRKQACWRRFLHCAQLGIDDTSLVVGEGEEAAAPEAVRAADPPPPSRVTKKRRVSNNPPASG